VVAGPDPARGSKAEFLTRICGGGSILYLVKFLFHVAAYSCWWFCVGVGFFDVGG